MALTLEAVQEVMSALKAEFNMRLLNISRDAPYWQERLLESRMTDENASKLRSAFVNQRTRTDWPTLNELARFLRVNVLAGPPAATAARDYLPLGSPEAL
ncbi:unnamed protein product, partial [marine sediment metagenome]